MEKGYDVLKIYIDNDVIRRMPQTTSKDIKYIVFFFMSLDAINFTTGEKIENEINNLSALGLDFKVLPVPICLFKSGYPESVSKKIASKSRKFFIDETDFRFLHELDEYELRDRLSIYFLCSKCKFMENNLCEGIQIAKADEKRDEKTRQWVFEEIPKVESARLLDLGCGYLPFIGMCMKFAEQKDSLFFCVDPLDISIKNFNDKIPWHLKSKIFPIIGLGEHLPFDIGTIDYVLLHYSYSHFMDLERTMKNIHRCLKKNGILVIFEAYHRKEDVYKENSEAKRIFWKNVFAGKDEFRNHNLDDAVKILENNGFEILDSFKNESEGQISWGIRSKKI